MNILFALSIFLVIFSSILYTLIVENKKIYMAICIFFLIVFGQVVLTYEILSLFSAITPVNVLIINFIFCIIGIILQKKTNIQPSYGEEFAVEKAKFLKSVKNDKMLNIIAILFTAFIFYSALYSYIMPTTDGDAISYHITRLPFWYEMHNLNHFEIADARAVVMPINSEIFYFWAYSFIKSDILVRFFSLFSFIFYIFAIMGFLKELKINFKTSLWIIFTTSAMYNIMLAVSGSETNITIASLISISTYLFLEGVKYDKKRYLFFATMAYSLAIGTKTPALQILPAFIIVVGSISYCYKKEKFYKPLLYCFGLLIFNFIIFGMYNYVLNFLEYGNPISSPSLCRHHEFMGGIKGFIANIIRYCAMFINFSGMDIPYAVGVNFSEAMWRIVTASTMFIIACLGIDPEVGILIPDNRYFVEGNRFENMMGLGILGFLVFIPSLFIAIKKLKKVKSTQNIILTAIAVGFIVNIIVLSCTVGYMIFSIRFIMSFVMIASPVIVYFFIRNRKNILKKIIGIIIIYNLSIGFYCYERKFTPFLTVKLYQAHSLQKFKEELLCQNETYLSDCQTCELIKATKINKKPIRVLYFAPSGIDLYSIKHAQNKNYQVDIRLLEKHNYQDIDWDSYDFILFSSPQFSSNILSKDIDIFRNSVVDYNDGKQGSSEYYDFNNENLIANCVFGSSREKIDWLKCDKNKITISICYIKGAILEKHNFKYFYKFNDAFNAPEKTIYVFVNTKKNK
jgi:Fe-S cluster assembly iron-binding protein IscA